MHSSASAPRRRLRATIVVTALALFALAVPTAASATVYEYQVVLSEATQNATGVPGDPGGKGKSKITMDTVSNQVCAFTFWENIDSYVAAGHIHQGAYGQPENPTTTINLFPSDFVNGVGSPARGCSNTVDGQIETIVACPPAYNVVIHSFNHPVAAIRGQLPGTCVTPPPV